jgi:hypothetical protein
VADVGHLEPREAGGRGRVELRVLLPEEVAVDLTAWGWVFLIVGVIQVLVGCGLLTAQEWARWAGIFIAALAAIGQIGIVTAFPIWSFIVILLAVLVIYNLIVHPYEPAPRRYGERQP